jgi:hypothetical protein
LRIKPLKIKGELLNVLAHCLIIFNRCQCARQLAGLVAMHVAIKLHKLLNQHLHLTKAGKQKKKLVFFFEKHIETEIKLTKTLLLPTLSFIYFIHSALRHCIVKFGDKPAMSNKKFDNICLPLVVRSTSGWNCTP